MSDVAAVFSLASKALISLLFVEGEGRLLGTVGVDGEEFEGAALDRGWPGVEGEKLRKRQTLQNDRMNLFPVERTSMLRSDIRHDGGNCVGAHGRTADACRLGGNAGRDDLAGVRGALRNAAPSSRLTRRRRNRLPSARGRRMAMFQTQTEKLVPHPQEAAAIGLLILNAAPIRSST